MSQFERSSAPETDADTPAVAEPGRRAAEEDLLDVAYATSTRRWGAPGVRHAAASCAWRTASEVADDVLAELASRVTPRVLRLPGRTDEVRHELDEYFAGARRGFDVPVDWSLVRGFARGSSVPQRTCRSARPRRTARWPGRWFAACLGRPATRWAPTRCPSWCPVTGCCTPAAGWVATAAGWSGSARC